MQPDEVVALGNLAGEALGEVTELVHEVHAGIASRVWRGLGPAATPVRLVHDAVASGVYSAVGRSLNVAARSGGRALSMISAPDAPPLRRGVRLRVAIGVLNGTLGDRLERQGNAFALGMSVRHQGRDLDPSPAALRRALPRASSKLAVFVHGFCETDDAWLLGSDRHVPYGARLEAELGYTPLYVRYNSGLPVEDSAVELAALLQRLTAAWPVRVEQVVLIGHGIGGALAARACDAGEGSDWERRVAEILTLGSAPPARSRRHRHHTLDYRRLGALRHLELLNDPGIYEQIRRLLAPPPALPAPDRAGDQRP